MIKRFLEQPVFDKTMRVLTHSLPHVLVWLALVFLMVSSFAEFTKSADFQNVAATFFSAMALVIGLASVTFTYASTKTVEDPEHDMLIGVGEKFLYSALIILVTLLIGWLVFQLNRVFVLFSWGGYVKVVLGGILILANLFLIFAADNLSHGIRVLERSLSERVRGN